MEDLNKYKVLVVSALVAFGAASLALSSMTARGGLASIFNAKNFKQTVTHQYTTQVHVKNTNMNKTDYGS